MNQGSQLGVPLGDTRIHIHARTLRRTMEDKKDHPDEEVRRSDRLAESDSTNGTGTDPEDAGRSEVGSTLDLSGLHELNGDAQGGDRNSLIGKSGFWPVLDDDETQPNHGLDIDLDDLSVTDSRNAKERGDEILSALKDGAAFRVQAAAWLNAEDRFVRTIRSMTGWSVDKSTVSSESPFSPIFTDGMKNYQFVDWKIHITFRRSPGIAELDWSPETLEEDVGRAASLAIVGDCSVDEAAGILRNRFSSEQLRQLFEILTEKV